VQKWAAVVVIVVVVASRVGWVVEKWKGRR
jgi:hypothetical protein